MDSSEDWTRITRISMRIGEKTRFAQIWPSASKIGFSWGGSIRANLRNVGVQIACPLSESPVRPLSYIFVRVGNGAGKQDYGNRPPIDDRNPIQQFSIDCLHASKTNNQTRPQLTRHCRETKRISRCGISVLVPYRRYGHRLRTPFLRTPFPRLQIFFCRKMHILVGKWVFLMWGKPRPSAIPPSG